MSTQILIKRSTTTGAVPTTSDIAVGELAINTVDKRIFTNNSGTIVELGTTPTTQAVTGNASVGGTFDVVGAVTVGNLTADGTVDLTAATVTIPAPTADTHPATKKYVDDEVNAILDGAPAALNTLNEIAAAINDDANLYTTLTNSIATKLSLSGGTMTGSIDMGANSITTSADPATANTLTRKSYVDGLYQSTVDAEVSAANALASEQAAATSATNAATSATASATSATASASSATNAASSATAAASSATSAANSATASATSATQSAASATQAQALVDSIESFYLGAEASAPTVDDNGDPLAAGDWYFNTTDNATYIYNGSSWQSVSPDLVADLTPQLGGDLSTNGNDITFGDNDKAIFGAGSDLQIYHDGAQSVVRDSGVGHLRIQAGDLRLENADGTATYLAADNGASLYAYYNGAVKLTTTSTGIDVTGTATMDGLTVDTGRITVQASVPTVRMTDTDLTNNYGEIRQVGADTQIVSRADTAYGGITLWGNNGSGFKKHADFDATGDISFYEDTGTTAKFFWDASAESLGIGTSSPARQFVLNATTPIMQFTNPTTGTTVNDGTMLYQAGTDFVIEQQDSGNIRAYAGGSERMRLDASGNLLVGKSSAGAATDGFEVNQSGTGYFVSTGAGTVGYLNRTTTDGSILEFRKDNTTVGSIGNRSTNLFVGLSPLGQGDVGITGSSLNTSSILPTDSAGTLTDNAASLGGASYRFKDLYLSGGVYLGGTGASNHLQDYEEGTWTPAFSANTAPTIVTHTFQDGKYIKVGNLVTVFGRIQISAWLGGSGFITIDNLPFNTPNPYSRGTCTFENVGFDTTAQYFVVGPRATSGSQLVVFQNKENGSAANIAAGDMSGDETITFTFTYTVQ